MKWFWFLTILATVFGERVVLDGDYYQIYSNRYVQMTSEIDIQCVNVSVRTDPENVVIIKTGYVHGLKTTPYNVTYVFKEIPPGILYSHDTVLDVRDVGPSKDYIIMSGHDNLSLYVWVKDVDQFNRVYKTIVQDRIDAWSYNNEVKAPLISYNVTVCDKLI
jgi:hypothetical protein